MNQKQYIREIIQRSCLPTEERKRLKSDLENEINTAVERGESIEQIIQRMGEPDKVAAALYENFADITARPFREYKSEKTLFGLPLVHIIRANYAPSVPPFRTVSIRGFNVGGRYGSSFGLPTARGIFAFGPKAKGVIAVGNFAAGFISIGNISTGILSIGNLSAGLFSIGNIALALLMTMGNFAAGLLSVGNMALGYATAGNLALGQYAVGNEAAGASAFSISNLIVHFEELKIFLAGLDAPAPVKAFYSMIEKISEILIDPISALPLAITLLAIVACVILLLWIIPKRLLNRNI